MNKTYVRALVAAASLGLFSGAFATNLLLNADFETSLGPIYAGAAHHWGNGFGNGFGNAGGWAPHANHPAGNNGTLGDYFGYYSPEAGTEIMGQILPGNLFEAGLIYTFGSWATNGGNSHVAYEIGYAAIPDVAGSFVSLNKAVLDITSEWAPYAGVTVAIATGDAAIGKQIMVAFAQTGTQGQGGAWVDNASLEVVPEPATLAVLGLGTLIAIRRRKA